MGANEKYEAALHGGEYTPSLSAVSNAYSNGSAYRITHQGAAAELDRFIAKIKAEAWDEGANASLAGECQNPPCGVCENCNTLYAENPYKVQS